MIPDYAFVPLALTENFRVSGARKIKEICYRFKAEAGHKNFRCERIAFDPRGGLVWSGREVHSNLHATNKRAVPMRWKYARSEFLKRTRRQPAFFFLFIPGIAAQSSRNISRAVLVIVVAKTAGVFGRVVVAAFFIRSRHRLLHLPSLETCANIERIVQSITQRRWDPSIQNKVRCGLDVTYGGDDNFLTSARSAFLHSGAGVERREVRS